MTTTTTVGDVGVDIDCGRADVPELGVGAAYFREAVHAITAGYAITGDIDTAVTIAREALGLAGELFELVPLDRFSGFVADSPTPWLSPDVWSSGVDASADDAPAGAPAGAWSYRIDDADYWARSHVSPAWVEYMHGATDDTPTEDFRPVADHVYEFRNVAGTGDIQVRYWEAGDIVDIATRPNERTPWSVPCDAGRDAAGIWTGRAQVAPIQRIFELDGSCVEVFVKVWPGRPHVDIATRGTARGGTGWVYPVDTGRRVS